MQAQSHPGMSVRLSESQGNLGEESKREQMNIVSLCISRICVHTVHVCLYLYITVKCHFDYSCLLFSCR